MTEERCHICGKPASYICNECKRPVCAEHHLDSGYDIWAGACQQCMEETERRTWENLKARQREAEDSPTADPPAPADPPDSPKGRLVVLREYAVEPAESDPPPDIDRDYVVRWLLAVAFTIAMGVLVMLSLQAGQILGVLLFGGLGARMIWAMWTSDSFRWLLGRVGQRRQRTPKPSPSDIDLHLRSLLNQHQDRVFTYLGRPEHVADLSMRGGPLADQEIYNLEYYSKGLRFYRREDPEILSIHFIHSGFDSYQTYPREILPGLRVGMTRREIDALLGPPEPDDPGARRGKWKTYNTDTLPTIDNLEVLYADADDPDAASIIIAIG